MADQANEKQDDGLLVTVSKKIGKAVGRVARTTGLERSEVAPSKKQASGKFGPKKKARLPRRQKKAAKKQAAKKQAAKKQAGAA
jgi:hypothetical protein